MEFKAVTPSAPANVVKHGVDAPESVEVRYVCLGCGDHKCVFGIDTTDDNTFQPRKDDYDSDWLGKDGMFGSDGKCPYIKGNTTDMKRINGDPTDPK